MPQSISYIRISAGNQWLESCQKERGMACISSRRASDCSDVGLAAHCGEGWWILHLQLRARALKASTLLKQVSAGAFDAVAELMKWTKAKGKPLRRCE